MDNWQGDVIAQLTGVVAVILSLAMFQVNKRALMLLLAMSGAFLYAAHFFMLGAVTGAAMNLIGAFRCYVFYKVPPSKSNTWILVAFICLAIAATIYTWQGAFSLLAMVGTILTAIASWQLKPKFIRRLSLTSPPFWFTYNAISGSYPGMFIEVFMLVSNAIGQYRFDFTKRARGLL